MTIRNGPQTPSLPRRTNTPRPPRALPIQTCSTVNVRQNGKARPLAEQSIPKKPNRLLHTSRTQTHAVTLTRLSAKLTLKVRPSTPPLSLVAFYVILAASSFSFCSDNNSQCTNNPSRSCYPALRLRTGLLLLYDRP